MSAVLDTRANLARERELLESLTPALRTSLVRFARFAGCNSEQAQDAAQRALIALSRKPEALAPENAALMRRMAVCEARKVLRDARRHDASDGGARFTTLDEADRETANTGRTAPKTGSNNPQWTRVVRLRFGVLGRCWCNAITRRKASGEPRCSHH